MKQVAKLMALNIGHGWQTSKASSITISERERRGYITIERIIGDSLKYSKISEDFLFVFLNYQEVPYYNNGSERGTAVLNSNKNINSI